MTEEQPSAAGAACAGIARRHDRERYLCALFAPADRRGGLFALYAFNHEIARIRSAAREPALARIRLQWWRDCLEDAFAGRERRHEVAAPLALEIRRHNLPRSPFDRLLDAREGELAGAPPPDLEALTLYCRATAGSLNLLALAVLGIGDPARQEGAARLGAAWALTGLLRASAHLARERRILIPADLQRAHGVSLANYHAGRDHEGLRRAATALADAARAHLAAAGPAGAGGSARAVMLQAVLARRHLRLLARCGHNVFDPRLAAPAPGAAWRLLLAVLAGRA